MSTFPNRRWLIIPATEVENIDFNQVLQNSADVLRYSIDGTKTFVKYDVIVFDEDQVSTYFDEDTQTEQSSVTPAGTYGRPSIYTEGMTEYTHEEILAVLAGPEWTTPDEDLV